MTMMDGKTTLSLKFSRKLTLGSYGRQLSQTYRPSRTTQHPRRACSLMCTNRQRSGRGLQLARLHVQTKLHAFMRHAAFASQDTWREVLCHRARAHSYCDSLSSTSTPARGMPTEPIAISRASFVASGSLINGGHGPRPDLHRLLHCR